jgi:site-specific recombinase XerD
MTSSRWHVRTTAAELPKPRSSPTADNLTRADGWTGWLARTRQTPGTSFLLSPAFDYDTDLNDFFRTTAMVTMAATTQIGYARDLASFLTFVNHIDRERRWRDINEIDHLSYLHWRRHDPDGPRVSGNTWNREVAAVNRFYRWAHTAGHVRANPIPQTWRRPAPAHTGSAVSRQSDELRPATYSHDGGRDRIQWLPLADYRNWREVGIRGFDDSGMPREGFRGRWSGRNATYCDVMVRTGLRISEQSALTVLELPHIDTNRTGYQRFWLPGSIAKGRSARWVYVPAPLVRDLATYSAFDRADVIAAAQEKHRYERIRHPLVVEDPERAIATHVTGAALKRTVKVSKLDWSERSC